LRAIRRSSKFRRDLKKAKKQRKNITLLKHVINQLLEDKELDKKFGAHPLYGNWRGYYELHITPDLLLIYKVSKDELKLARLSSHSDLYK